jgi:hypothetical protein
MEWLSNLFGSSTRDFEVGYYEEYGLGFEVSLLFKEQGWYIWKIQNGDSISLMMIKPATGESPPKPSGLVWCYGGKGFYGSQQYRGSVKCLFKGKLFDSLTEDELLNMEGSNVRFEVTTAPRKATCGL